MFVPSTKYNSSKANILYLMFVAQSNPQYFGGRGWLFPSQMIACLDGLTTYGSLRVLIGRYSGWGLLTRESERYRVGGKLFIKRTGRYALTKRGLKRLHRWHGKGLVDEAGIKANVVSFLDKALADGHLVAVESDESIPTENGRVDNSVEMAQLAATYKQALLAHRAKLARDAKH